MPTAAPALPTEAPDPVWDWEGWTPADAPQLGARLARDADLWWATVRALSRPGGAAIAHLDRWLAQIGVADRVRTMLAHDDLSAMARCIRLTGHLQDWPTATAFGGPMGAAQITVLGHRAIDELADPRAEPTAASAPSWWLLDTLTQQRAYGQLGALPGGQRCEVVHEQWPRLWRRCDDIFDAPALPTAISRLGRGRAQIQMRLLVAILNTTAEATSLRFEADRLRRTTRGAPPWFMGLLGAPRAAGIDGIPLDLAVVVADEHLRAIPPAPHTRPRTPTRWQRMRARRAAQAVITPERLTTPARPWGVSPQAHARARSRRPGGRTRHRWSWPSRVGASLAPGIGITGALAWHIDGASPGSSTVLWLGGLAIGLMTGVGYAALRGRRGAGRAS